MKRLISIITMLTMCFTLCSCMGGKETKSINIYFKNTQTSELVVESIRYAGSQNTVDMARFALDHLLSGPENTSLLKTLPENTSLLSLSVKDGVANVDFSKELSAYSGIDELLARFSIVRTLCDIPGITKVSITLEGMPLVSNATGNEVGVLSKKDVVIDIDMVDSNSVTTTIKMYFATGDGTSLKAENRNVKTQNTISIEKTIMNELLKGPSSHELSSVIPSGTKVLNVETKDSVCYVNFSEEFVSKFPGGTGMLPVYSVVNSLCSLESVQSVQILIEGEKGAEFGNFVFDEPFVANYDIVIQ